ncbi:MAG: hypothetical protein ACP5N7_04390 [Candidatus Pacearchaeota archaeon]
MSTDRNTDGLQDNLAKSFVRDFLRPYLRETPDTRFFLFESRGRHYASAVKRVAQAEVENLVLVSFRPLSERQYHQLARVYGDSFIRVEPILEFANSQELSANLQSGILGPLTKEQREYLSKKTF